MSTSGRLFTYYCSATHKSALCKRPTASEIRPSCLAFNSDGVRPCPAGWLPSSGGRPGCYRKLSDASTWLHSLGTCKDLGGTLASWSDSTTARDVLGACGRTWPSRCAVGLSDRVQESTWRWEDGSEVPANLRTLTESRSTDDCSKLYVSSSSSTSGTLSAVGCNGEASSSNLHGLLCRKPLTPSVNGVVTPLSPGAPDITVSTSRSGPLSASDEGDTGVCGRLEFPSAGFVHDGPLNLIVSFDAGDKLDMLYQAFQILMTPPSGGAAQPIASAVLVANGGAFEVIFDAPSGSERGSILPGSTLQLAHALQGAEATPALVGSFQYRSQGCSDGATRLTVPVDATEPAVKLAAPLIEPGSGYFSDGVVTLVMRDPNDLPGSAASVRFTLDGTQPSLGSAGTYTYRRPITFDARYAGSSLRVVAVAAKTGFVTSDTATATYRLADEECPAANGVFCTPGQCSRSFFWCVGGSRATTQ